MIELRTYQQRAVEEIRTALNHYRRVLFCAPCGMGKTICFSYIASKQDALERKVLIISNRCEILEQNGGAMQSFGIDLEYINPKNRKIPTKRIVCAMAQTLRRRMQNPEWEEYVRGFDFFIIDECHSCDSDFIHPYIGRHAFLLGCSATPSRRSHQAQLGFFYKAMVVSVSVKELISLGYLSKSHHYSIIAPSLDGLNIDSGTGDYNRKQLAARYESKKLYTGIVNEYLRITPHKKAICFCVSAKQAIEMTKEFNDRGVSARYVLSGSFDEDATYSGKRDEVFEAFKNNEFEVLVNVSVCTAGFDQRDIEVVILNFATVSLSKYLQAVGRGSRVTDTKHDFYVLDAGCNVSKFGVYEADRTFCLWHDEHKSGGVMAMKECDTTKKDINGKFGCGQLVPSTVKVCPACGYVFRTEQYEYQLHLEEVTESNASETIAGMVAQKRLEGWSTARIMVQVCLKNAGRERKAFIEAYKVLNPKKDINDAMKYWYVFKHQIWDKIKHKRSVPKENTLGL